MCIFIIDPDEPLTLALLLMVTSLSLAVVMVVSEAIMVQQSRLDSKFGSQDFLSINFIGKGIGGVIGCVFAGIMTENYHPKWCLFYYSFVGLFLFIFSLFLTKEVEHGNA